jgi:uncharacterized membrane protein YeaQ/YmgE (transglycosylase-associated protein family)
MESGVYNFYWWLSYAAPILIMFIACSTRKRWIYLLGLICSFVATWNLNFLAVTTKWQIRNSTAVTSEEVEVATSDGANIVFTAILFGPLEALILTLIFGWIGQKIWRHQPNALATPVTKRQESPTES